MRRRVLLSWAIVALMATVVLAESKQPAKIAWERDLEKGRESQLKLERPMLLFVTSPGCVYCDRMKAETFANSTIAKKISADFVAVQINGRKYSDIVRRLKLRAYPTTAFVHKNGTVVELLQGYKSAASFTKHIARVSVKLSDQEKLAAVASGAARK